MGRYIGFLNNTLSVSSQQHSHLTQYLLLFFNNILPYNSRRLWAPWVGFLLKSFFCPCQASSGLLTVKVFKSVFLELLPVLSLLTSCRMDRERLRDSRTDVSLLPDPRSLSWTRCSSLYLQSKERELVRWRLNTNTKSAQKSELGTEPKCRWWNLNYTSLWVHLNTTK